MPPLLKPGALFGLVSPAGKTDPEALTLAEKFLSEHGYRSIRGLNAAGSYHQFAGRDSDRLFDLQTMMDAPDVDVIWCVRGGYGAIRIVEQLDWQGMKRHPKWLVGFSDITVLQAALFKECGMPSVHGPMPKNMLSQGTKPAHWLRLLNILRTGRLYYHSASHFLNRYGNASGTLIGGNLSMLVALRGTPYDFDPRGKILFIEEVGEKLYHLDRMMYNLKLGGKLEGLAGLVVGHLSEMTDNETPFGSSAEEIIHQAVEAFDYPVLFGFPAGHDVPNEPLILGREVTIKVDEEGGRILT